MVESERIKQAFDYLKSNKLIRNQQDFVERMNSDKSTVSQILNGKKEANILFVRKMKQSFEMLSEEWLLEGTGEMIIEVKKEMFTYELDNNEILNLKNQVKEMEIQLSYQNETIIAMKETIQLLKEKNADLEKGRAGAVDVRAVSSD